jgi:hypothetical protein
LLILKQDLAKKQRSWIHSPPRPLHNNKAGRESDSRSNRRTTGSLLLLFERAW